jgi:acetolactate synthase I/II/III large subunit
VDCTISLQLTGARQVLITNGQQTLGVALPWGIAGSLVRPSEKILSISGDGGFLYSAMELETAVRLKANLVHMIWVDGTYDMVATQEKLKYGRPSGTDFGPVDFVKYAEAFGATGLMINTPADIAPVMRKAFDTAVQSSSQCKWTIKTTISSSK